MSKKKDIAILLAELLTFYNKDNDKFTQNINLAIKILDINNENNQAIKQYLDRAILEANQRGGAIVLGHTSAATLDAIENWYTKIKKAKITLAPISAVFNALNK